MQCTWDDFNFPCRMSTYAAAGLPFIQLRNKSHIVASNNYIKNKQVGIFFDDVKHLASKLFNERFMEQKHTNMLSQMMSFSFDYNVPDLITFFNKVIKNITHNNSLH